MHNAPDAIPDHIDEYNLGEPTHFAEVVSNDQVPVPTEAFVNVPF